MYPKQKRVFLVLLLLCHGLRLPLRAQLPQGGLRIVIVEGEGAINNVRERVNRDPIVQVEDENRRPIAGAAVVFFLPDQGASGVFVNGSRTLTVTTDAQGRAVARGIRPNNVSGDMQIRVTASFQGQTASAIITQTNVGGAAAGSTAPATSTATVGGGMSLGTKLIIILAIAGAATAGGVVAATRGGNSNTNTGPPAPPAIVLAPGTPTVTGPR